ncbi:MAG: hypothetical protein MHM6MM_004664 [Cercozoa sp. M6MM]
MARARFVGLDLGTTSAKLVVLSDDLEQVLSVSKQYPADAIDIVNCNGRHEQDARVIATTALELLRQLPWTEEEITLCVTGQMHGVIAWSSDQPVTHVSTLVTWRDRDCARALERHDDRSDAWLCGTVCEWFVYLLQTGHVRECSLCDQSDHNDRGDHLVTMHVSMAQSWPAHVFAQNRGPKRPTVTVLPVSHTVRVSGMPKLRVLTPVGDATAAAYVCIPWGTGGGEGLAWWGAILCIRQAAQQYVGKQGVLTFGTSAQVTLLSHVEQDCRYMDRRSNVFGQREISVFASMNGGSTLQHVVHLIDSFRQGGIDDAWNFLRACLQAACDSEHKRCCTCHCSPQVSPERGEETGHVSQVKFDAFPAESFTAQTMILSYVEGVFRNIFALVPASVLSSLDTLALVGSIFGRIPELKHLVSRVLHDYLGDDKHPIELQVLNIDASSGAALLAHHMHSDSAS